MPEEEKFRLRDWRRFMAERPDLYTAMDNQRATTAGIIGNDILLHILDKVEDMKEYLYLATPEGIFDQVTVPVGPGVTELTQLNPLTPSMPWKAVDVYNAGQPPIYVGVNKPYITNPTPIVCGQQIRIELGRNQIRKLIISTSYTNSASVLSSAGSGYVRLYAVK